MIPSIDPGLGTLLLLGLLVVSFIVAFKIMNMIIETILASVLSGVFYIALAYFFSFPLSLSNVLLFTFLGASLYMGYSFLATTFTLAETAVSIPLKLLGILLLPFKKIYGYLKKKRKLKELRKDTKENAEKDAENVKDVVLDKVKKD